MSTTRLLRVRQIVAAAALATLAGGGVVAPPNPHATAGTPNTPTSQRNK